MRVLPSHPVAIALLLLVPTASAAWSSQGDLEPNTPYDASTMWRDAYLRLRDGHHHQVYFNVVLSSAESRVNPNVALLGSRIEVPTAHTPIAFLGVWSDCNGDESMGNAEQGTLIYASALLFDDSYCPPVDPVVSNTYPHNDGTTVRELIWFGWLDNRAPIEGETVPDIVDTPEMRVWGDFGRPDAPVTRCPLAAPAGTFRSASGIFAYVDCRDRARVNDELGPVREALGIEGAETCAPTPVDVQAPLFYDRPACPSGTPGYLEPGTGSRFADVWDCGDEPQLAPELIGDEDEDEDEDGLTGGSGYDTAAHAVAPLVWPCETGTRELDAAYAGILPESRLGWDGLKRSTSFSFEFVDERGAYPTTGLAALLEPTEGRTLQAVLALDTLLGPRWIGRATSPEEASLLRDELLETSDGVGEGGRFFTYYAGGGAIPNVDRHARTQAPSTGGADYDLPCALADCIRSHWWDPAYTSAQMPVARRSGLEYGVSIAHPVLARDVDCYDGTPASDTPSPLTILSATGPCT